MKIPEPTCDFRKVLAFCKFPQQDADSSLYLLLRFSPLYGCRSLEALGCYG